MKNALQRLSVSKGNWPQEELPRDISVCWPWNWWCSRGDLPEEEEECLIQEATGRRFDLQESSDDELLRDHVVSQEDIATVLCAPQPSNDAQILRQRVDQLEQQLKREQQQRRCYEDKIEHLRQLYESARTAQLQQTQEETEAQQQTLRIKEMQHQLQQNAIERKHLEEALLKETEGRQNLEDLLRAQILDKELQLRRHLEEEEIQRRKLQQEVDSEKVERIYLENVLQKIELQKESLQKKNRDLELKLGDEVKRRVEIEKELFLAQTSEQELHHELKDIRKYLSKTGKVLKLPTEPQPEEKLLRPDVVGTNVSEIPNCSSEDAYWSIPENDGIFGDGRLTEPSKTQENEDLRTMLERAVEEKIRLQRALQKEMAVRLENQIRAKKELKLQRKLMEKEFRKEFNKIEQMFSIGNYDKVSEETRTQDKKEIFENVHIRDPGSPSSDSISVASEVGTEEDVSTEDESEEEAQTEDIISDVMTESVDEEERQEIRQLLLEELQRLQAHAKEEQELRREGGPKQENENYLQRKKQDGEMPSSELSDENPEDVKKDTILDERIQAILKKQPFIVEGENLYSDNNRSRAYEDEIMARNNITDKAPPLTIHGLGIETHVFTNQVNNLPQDSPHTETQVNKSLNMKQINQDDQFRCFKIVNNAETHDQTNVKTLSEPGDQQLLKYTKPELLKDVRSDHKNSAVSSQTMLLRIFASEDEEFLKCDPIQANELDGTNEPRISRSTSPNTFKFDVDNANNELYKKVLVSSVKFQGQTISVRALIGNEEPSHELFTLFQKYSKENVALAPFELGVQRKHIRRSVQRNIYLKEDLFKHKFSSLRTTFGISGVSKEELECLVPPGNAVGQLKYSGVENPARTFLVLEDATAENDYNELCANAKGFRDIHWLQKDLSNRQFMWKKSSSNLKDIRKHIQTQRNITYPSLAEVNERCSVITASSGEGTSVFLEQLSADFKKRDFMSWIVKLDVSRIIQGTIQSCVTHEQLFEILWEATACSLDLEKKLLEHYFYRTGNIIVLLQDAHKNVPGSQMLLKALLETKIRRMIVTVHSQWQNVMEDCASTLAFTLKPLNETEQMKILIQRWNIAGDKKHIEDFSVALLRAAAQGRLALTPLHLTMLADIHNVSLETYLCKSYIEIPTLIDEKTLYERYIEIYFKQQTVENDSQFQNDKLKDMYFSSTTYDALQLLFSEHSSLFPSIDEVNGRPKLKVKALHCCIMEYLCAKWFAKHFEECRPLVRETYFVKHLQRVWFLFDKILANTSELHIAALFDDISRVKELIDAGVDVHALDNGGRKPIHLASIQNHALVIKMLVQAMENMPSGKDRVLEWTSLRYADESENLEVMELLLEAGECPSDLENAKQSVHDERDFQTIISTAASAGYKNLLCSLLNTTEFSVNTILHSRTHSHQNYTLLHIVAENGHTEVVDYLIRLSSVRTDLGSWDGSTPLHLAARRGHTEIARRLISRTSALIFNKLGDTPLHEAVRNGYINVATVLLAEGDADPNLRNVMGEYPLHIACSNGDITFVSLLLEYGAEKNRVDGKGDTPLDCAIGRGQSTVVRYLVEKCGKHIIIGAEGKGINQNTSLHVAARIGDTLSMEYLLRVVGSEAINTPNEGGDAPLHFAALQGRSTMVEYLISKCGADPARTNRYGNTAVHLAVVRDDYSTVRVLLAHSPVLIEKANCEGNIPLHLAARRGNLQMIRCLLQHGQNKHTVTLKNREMKTPLQLAVERSDVDIVIVQTLVEAGSDVNVRDRHGNTLLHQAVCLARSDIAKLLLNTGLAVTELKNYLGYTALLSAVKAGQLKVLIVLSEGGADVNVRASDGNTALHVAVAAGNLDIALALLELGANPDTRNAEGNTALHRAVYVNNVDMVRLLVEYGADKNSMNIQGQSPKDVALQLHAKENILLYL